MHELSVAQSILDIVQHHVPEEERRAVRSVRVTLGAQSGVVRDSLEFCYSALIAETPLSASVLVIEERPFLLRCNDCKREYANDAGTILCPVCGGIDTTILSGTELLVTAVDLDDGESEAT
jgi:hydrogenase nickel incorporation protein HypA/HybF